MKRRVKSIHTKSMWLSHASLDVDGSSGMSRKRVLLDTSPTDVEF